MDKQIALLGGGGHGCVVLDALLSSDAKVHGVLDPHPPAGGNLFGVPYLGTDAWLDTVLPETCILANGLGCTPGSPLRANLHSKWKERGFDFATIIHPSVVLGRCLEIAEGVQVMAGVVLQPRIAIGENAVVNTRASIDHDCEIGTHAFVGPGAILCGNIRVGNHAFIGAGATILPGVYIGEFAIVAAGATVTRDVPEGSLVAGTPAKPLVSVK